MLFRSVGASVPVLLALDADIAQAERLAVAAALATEGVLAAPAPLLLADPGITATHLQYKLVFRVPSQSRAGLVKTHIVNRMLTEFRQAGVSLPDARTR